MSPPAISDVLAAAGVTVFERGWLSANNVLLQGHGPSALVDSGYGSHARQTVALVSQALGHCTLDLLLNTHLHSDHCGGNAALKERYPGLQTWIPPGQADAVDRWNTVALTYATTGQECPRFTHQGLLRPDSCVRLGALDWEIHAAKGHDPHSIILFQPATRLLISADALWQNGFGVVFPELEGVAAFDEVAQTLDAIEALQPETVIPGHGPVFQDISEALDRARTRLSRFVNAPTKHHRHAVKVLIKFRLLEWQSIEQEDLLVWARNTPYLRASMPPDQHDPIEQREWLHDLLVELEHSNAIHMQGSRVVNA